jgi:hypothetical protein
MTEFSFCILPVIAYNSLIDSFAYHMLEKAEITLPWLKLLDAHA